MEKPDFLSPKREEIGLGFQFFFVFGCLGKRSSPERIPGRRRTTAVVVRRCRSPRPPSRFRAGAVDAAGVTAHKQEEADDIFWATPGRAMLDSGQELRAVQVEFGSLQRRLVSDIIFYAHEKLKRFSNDIKIRLYVKYMPKREFQLILKIDKNVTFAGHGKRQ